MSAEDQANKLNERVKIRLAPSKIHGIGVFAIRDIAKGQKLFADHMPEVYSLSYGNFGKLFLEVKELLLERWPNIVSGSNFIYPDSRMLAYMNHSEDASYDTATDTLTKDVKVGEEITEDYRLIQDYALVYPWLA